MDPILIGILVCGGFMLLVITLIRAMMKARKLRRQQQQNFDDYDPYTKQ